MANLTQTITEINQTITESKEQINKNSPNGSFPTGIKAAVQYGKNLQALVVAFNTVGISRTHEILSSKIPLAAGTIKNMVIRCVDAMSGVYETICQTIAVLGLIRCDETGTCVDGKI